MTCKCICADIDDAGDVEYVLGYVSVQLGIWQRML